MLIADKACHGNSIRRGTEREGAVSCVSVDSHCV